MSRADDAFDAGITALRENQLPTAIAKLLEAHVHEPTDTEIADALTFARFTAQTTSHVQPPVITTVDFALGWVVVNVALAAVIALQLRRGWKIAVVALWMVCAGLWLASLLTQATYGVVAQPEIAAHVADDETSLERYRLKAGDEVRVEGRIGEWLKVVGGNGEKGYVKAEQITEIR